QAIWEEFAAEHPVDVFPSSRTMRDNSRLFTAGKRYRYALALAGYQLLTGEPPSRGLERAATWLEWCHLYTLLLDDIMDEDVRRSEARAARLYLGAAATAAIAARASSEDRAALEAFARYFAIAFQDRDDLLGAGVVQSRIGGSAEGDIRQGKRTRLFVLALQRLAPKD